MYVEEGEGEEEREKERERERERERNSVQFKKSRKCQLNVGLPIKR